MSFFFIINLLVFFFLLYNIVLVLPHINMNLPRVYMCSQSRTPFLLPTNTIPPGHPSAPAPSILHPALNLDWQFVSYMILYMFQCQTNNVFIEISLLFVLKYLPNTQSCSCQKLPKTASAIPNFGELVIE